MWCFFVVVVVVFGVVCVVGVFAVLCVVVEFFSLYCSYCFLLFWFCVVVVFCVTRIVFFCLVVV